tara:strand:- start:3896 stop:4462 length:567 start_codon:yes stop_codon:yes gene_type:complete
LKKIFLTSTVVVLLDQISKVLVKTNMRLSEEHLVFGLDWFIIHFTENNGMAFGMEFGGEVGKILLSLFRIIIVLYGIKYLFKLNKSIFPKLLLVSIGLILGGAIGNIIDGAIYGLIFSESTFYSPAIFTLDGYGSFLQGKVVDMLYFPIISTTLNGSEFIFFRPVFNLADSAISIGVTLILIFYRKYF